MKSFRLNLVAVRPLDYVRLRSHSVQSISLAVPLPPPPSQAKKIAFRICISVYSQHQWRFVKPFAGWPYKLLWGMLRPKSELQKIVHGFFSEDTPLCCLESKMSYKLRHQWKDEHSMLRDEPFWRALGLFGREAKITNMHVERLLAMVKRSVHQKVPTMERLCQNGFMTDCLRAHTASGGYDPRVDTAEQYSKMGFLSFEICKDRLASRVQLLPGCLM